MGPDLRDMVKFYMLSEQIIVWARVSPAPSVEHIARKVEIGKKKYDLWLVVEFECETRSKWI